MKFDRISHSVLVVEKPESCKIISSAPLPAVNVSTIFGAKPPNKVLPKVPAVISSLPSAPKNLSISLFAKLRTPSKCERLRISLSLAEVIVPFAGLPSINRKLLEFSSPRVSKAWFEKSKVSVPPASKKDFINPFFSFAKKE